MNDKFSLFNSPKNTKKTWPSRAFLFLSVAVSVCVLVWAVLADFSPTDCTQGGYVPCADGAQCAANCAAGLSFVPQTTIVFTLAPAHVDYIKNPKGRSHAHVFFHPFFPDNFASVIKGFPQPLASEHFEPMAGVIHLAVWRARAEENHYSKEEMEATIPKDVLAKIGISSDYMLTEMPPISELAAGLEELVS